MAVSVLTSGVQYTRKILGAAEPDILKAALTLIRMALAGAVCAICLRRWAAMLGSPAVETDAAESTPRSA